MVMNWGSHISIMAAIAHYHDPLLQVDGILAESQLPAESASTGAKISPDKFIRKATFMGNFDPLDEEVMLSLHYPEGP